MPIYTYRCPSCRRTAEVVQTISSYSAAPQVPECPVCPGLPAVQMVRYFTVPMTAMDRAPWAGYVSPMDGKTFIDSRAKEREMMAVHGVVPFQEIQPDFERNRKDFLKKSTEGVKEAAIDAMHMVESGYKPKLETEIIPSA